jgi:hypothetical protein
MAFGLGPSAWGLRPGACGRSLVSGFLFLVACGLWLVSGFWSLVFSFLILVSGSYCRYQAAWDYSPEANSH